MSDITENKEARRFELLQDGKLAFADYRLEEGVLILPHVEADPALRGKGAAAMLMTGVLDLARQRGLKVTPLCSYAAAFIERHPVYRDLLSD